VIVNVIGIRSGVIIITNSIMISVELPQLTETDIIKWIQGNLIIYKISEEKGKRKKE
jgi:hypothetical protein